MSTFELITAAELMRREGLMGEQFQPGDLCDCRELGRCEVLAVLPDGLLRLRTATRCPVLVRAAVCKKFHTRNE